MTGFMFMQQCLFATQLPDLASQTRQDCWSRKKRMLTAASYLIDYPREGGESSRIHLLTFGIRRKFL